MFRVNKNEWINPTLKGVEYVEIRECGHDGKTVFYVNIHTDDGDNFSSEYFDSFDDAEDFVKELCDAM